MKSLTESATTSLERMAPGGAAAASLDDASILFARARKAATRQGWHDAAALYQRAVEVAGDAAPASWLAAWAMSLRRAANWAEAERVHGLLRERWPQDAAGWSGTAAAATAQARWEEAAIAWQACCTRFPHGTRPEWLANLAQALRQLRRYDEAAEAHRRLRDGHPELPVGWVAEARMLTANRQIEQAIAAWRECLRRFPAAAEPEWFRKLTHLLRRMQREEEAQAVLDEAAERWPEALLAPGSTAPEAERGRAAEFCVVRAEIAVRRGDGEAALALLARTDGQPVRRHVAGEIAALRDAARALRPAGAPAMPAALPAGELSARFDDPDASVITWRNAEASETAILVFASGGADFWLAMDTLHRKLRGAGCHLIYMRDRNLGFFLERAGSWNGFREIAEGLRQQLAALGVTRLCCLGTSMGGYGALRYGIELGATAVLAFGAVTDPEAQTTDPGLLPRLRRTQPGLAIDPVPLYREAERRPRVTLCYGSDNLADRAAAHRLKGIPGVRFLAAQGVKVHAVIRWFFANGGFETLVEAMLSDDPAPVSIEGAAWEPAA